jgi:hypothetical protein
MRRTATTAISMFALVGVASGDELPGGCDPRALTCTARILPCWGDYTMVIEACTRSRACSESLIARVTADYYRVLATCTHTGMP